MPLCGPVVNSGVLLSRGGHHGVTPAKGPVRRAATCASRTCTATPASRTVSRLLSSVSSGRSAALRRHDLGDAAGHDRLEGTGM